MTIDELKAELDQLPGDARVYSYCDGYLSLDEVVPGNGGFVLVPA